MMLINDILTELKKQKIYITVEGNNLKIRPLKGHTPSLELLKQIKTNKKQLIKLLSTGLYKEPPPLIQASRDRYIPLSFAQSRLWFINQYEEGSSISYSLPWGVHLTGKLNVAALQFTFQTIVDRHESLRTTFQILDGKTVQVIADSLTLNFPVININKNKVPNFIHENNNHLFNLTTGPLIRICLLKLMADQHVLLVNMHHIISDGWSGGVLIKEMTALYGAYVQGKPSPLQPLPIQYADFSIWQRNWLQGMVLEEQVNYWKQQLDGAPRLLELPYDYPRRTKQSYRGATESFQISKSLSEQVAILARKERVTLFMLLMTVFQFLLSRYSRQLDICIGTPIANRKQSVLNGLIGFFANTLVIRTKIDNQLFFRDLLKKVKVTTLAAFRYQDLPFDQVVEAVNPERSISYLPLFQVALSFGNIDRETLAMSNISISPIQSELETTQCDLILKLSESDHGLQGRVTYDIDLFKKITIKRFIQHFQMLLVNITGNSEQKLFNLSLLTQQERKLILFDWNQTDTIYPRDKCIHQLFERQVNKACNALAVTYQNKSLSYLSLNTQSNRLAHYLIKRGVVPNTRVGVLVKRSLEMIISVVGILKANAAYVPIDPDYPTQRIDDILTDSGVKVLITQHELVRELSLPSNLCTLLINDTNLLPDIKQYPDSNPDALVDPDDLAYMIYTSGSTGKPKGILLNHRGLANLSVAQGQLFEVTRKSRVLQFASLGFDAATWEWVMALNNGAKLCLIDADVGKSGNELTEYIQHSAITHATLPPALLSLLDPVNLPNLSYLIVAGEACSEIIAQRWCSGRHFFNAYGSSETTVCASIYHYTEESQFVSIGRPLPNFRLYVLDEYLNPVPIGTIGELYIGGLALARGYYNKPDLTAEKFIPNPFSKVAGERLYRSGDLVRYRPDGNIVFIGRADLQVKIRGFRVELGEIESVLNKLTGVSDTHVLALSRDNTNQIHYLVAYVIPEHGKQLSQEQLRNAVQTVLPRYMVPSFFVILKQWPLTENGKIDKRALPRPNIDILQARKYVTPSTKIEQQIAAIWAQVLDIEVTQVGVYSDFFDLGGNSLLIITAIQKIKDKLGVGFSIRDFYNVKHIRGLIALARQGSHEEEIVSIQEADLKVDIVPCGKVKASRFTRSIFLTGSTGFIGRFLLTELLDKTDATVYCLVRADSDTKGHKRLKAKLIKWQLWSDTYENRVITVSGDLAQPQFGMSNRSYRYLCRHIDTIIHSGTYMSHLDTYDTMKEVNVDGLQSIIRLACTCQQKMIHYISTTGVFTSMNPGFSSIDEDSPIYTQTHSKTYGYGATKWIAENMLMNVRHRGIPSNIFRLGLVSGDTKLGRSDMDQWFTRVLKICINLGCGFDDSSSRWLPITPVDFVVRAVVKLVLDDNQNKTFHITANQSYGLMDLIKRYNLVSEKPLKIIPYQDFIALVREKTKNKNTLPFVPFIHGSLFDDNNFLVNRSSLIINSDKTMTLLNSMGIKLPDIDCALISKYFDYIEKIEY